MAIPTDVKLLAEHNDTAAHAKGFIMDEVKNHVVPHSREDDGSGDVGSFNHIVSREVHPEKDAPRELVEVIHDVQGRGN